MKKLFFLCLFIVILTSSCKDLFIRQVKYEVVGGVSSVDLTITNSDGGTSQFQNEPLPWTYSFEADKDDFIYVSAQNQDNSGSITVTIYVNGDVFKSSPSSGAYCIATASGSTP